MGPVVEGPGVPAAKAACDAARLSCATTAVWAAVKFGMAVAALWGIIHITLPSQQRWDGWVDSW